MERSSAVPVRFGIVGTGYMGRQYAACLREYVPHGQLTAVWGGSRAGKLATEFGVEAESTLESLVGRSDVDAVIIATPHSGHLLQATTAAAAGKHVYLEKPMALDIDECDAIIESCRAAGVKL